MFIPFAVMVIWFGTGQYSRFDVERFNSMAECEAAKVVITESYDSFYSNIPEKYVSCLEVKE